MRDTAGSYRAGLEGGKPPLPDSLLDKCVEEREKTREVFIHKPAVASAFIHVFPLDIPRLQPNLPSVSARNVEEESEQDHDGVFSGKAEIRKSGFGLSQFPLFRQTAAECRAQPLMSND